MYNLEIEKETYNEKHLPVVLMWKEEQSENCRHWYFVIKSFSMKLEERLENFDVITTPIKE